ncbi:redoxin domain-containing protein [bacterium]|nr:redoxin domain-containing protein [bacterium]
MQSTAANSAPAFPEPAEWLNTARPLSLEELKGKVVLLDFWTYCCINCMHIIPDLKRLEAKYPDELVVIGVHSAKFDTEKVTQNIREAVLRYEIEHPVINDHDMSIWNAYGVRAWPTVVLIDPQGNIAGRTSGEGIFGRLDGAIQELVDEFDSKGLLDRTPVEMKLEKEQVEQTPLSFPGKITAHEASGRLFLTDSNHNQVLVISLEGQVQQVIGQGGIGLEDGDFESARFFHPQGLYYEPAEDAIYVADTENHAIRRIDLASGMVETLAGTGSQAQSYPGLVAGTKEKLNSPWDLLKRGDLLYIAMAGPHQLWTLNVKTGEVAVFAGSGYENIVDGPLLNAQLAQPSGITTDGKLLYFADSETSSIRSAGLDAHGVVSTLIGAGLFDFGDIDGSYPAARLQHPIGVLYHDGYLYVADTYNHKIKRLDPRTTEVETIVGTGEPGAVDGEALAAQLNEPNDITFAAGKFYIADTNNHLIRVYDPAAGSVSVLALSGR